MILLADLPNLTDPGLLTALLTLTVLEIILGVDNIIFISIVSNNLQNHSRKGGRGNRIVRFISYFQFMVYFKCAFKDKENAPCQKNNVFPANAYRFPVFFYETNGK